LYTILQSVPAPRDRPQPSPGRATFLITTDLLLQAAVSGILLGAIYALVALSLALIFGVMRVLNFAHGDLLMIAMYGVAYLHQSLGWHPYVAALALLPLMALVGLVMFRLLIKPVLLAEPLTQAQLTLGLSFILQSVMLWFWGADLVNVQTSLGTAVVHLGDAVITLPLLLGAVASLLASFALAWVLLRTEFGWQVRATAEDPVMATLSGIAVPRTRLLVFAGGVALLAIPAGALMTFYYVTPFVGIHFSILSLLIVTLGGLGDLRGAFFGGLIIGLVESMSSALIAGPAAGSAIYVVFGILLVFRPRGLFGRGVLA
jgi:branched-chain amino acid transport system permease protein